jgi:hypothetical protein
MDGVIEVSGTAKYKVHKINDNKSQHYGKYIVWYLKTNGWLRNNNDRIVVYDTYEAVPSRYKKEEEEEENQYPNPDGGGKYKRFVRTIRKRQRKSRPTTRRHKRSSRTTSRRRYRKK